MDEGGGEDDAGGERFDGEKEVIFRSEKGDGAAEDRDEDTGGAGGEDGDEGDGFEKNGFFVVFEVIGVASTLARCEGMEREEKDEGEEEGGGRRRRELHGFRRREKGELCEHNEDLWWVLFV